MLLLRMLHLLLGMYLEHSILYLLERLLHFLYLIFGQNELSDFERDPSESDHISSLQWRPHLLQVLEHEPSMVLYDGFRFTLVDFIWERLTYEVVLIVIHDVKYFARLSLQLLLVTLLSDNYIFTDRVSDRRDWQGVELTSMLDTDIVSQSMTYDIYKK